MRHQPTVLPALLEPGTPINLNQAQAHLADLQKQSLLLDLLNWCVECGDLVEGACFSMTNSGGIVNTLDEAWRFTDAQKGNEEEIMGEVSILTMLLTEALDESATESWALYMVGTIPTQPWSRDTFVDYLRQRTRPLMAQGEQWLGTHEAHMQAQQIARCTPTATSANPRPRM